MKLFLIRFLGVSLILILVFMGLLLALAQNELAPSELKNRYIYKSTRVMKLGSADVYYDVFGQGPKVLVLHDLFSSRHEWVQWASELAHQGFQVYALSLPGSGLSDALPNNFTARESLPRYVAFLNYFVAQLGMKSFSCLAHGFAAQFCVRLSALRGVRQPFVQSLVLFAPEGLSGSSRRPEYIWAPVPIVGHLLMHATTQFFIRAQLYWEFMPQYAAVHDQWVKRRYELINKRRNRATMLQLIKDRHQYAISENMLQSLSVKSLILWGQEDRMVPYKFASTWKNKLRYSQLVSYNGLGHWLSWVNRQETVRVVSQFLRKNTPKILR